MNTFIKFELWDLDHTAGHKLLGSIETSLRQQHQFSAAQAKAGSPGPPVFKLNPSGTPDGAALCKPLPNTKNGRKRSVFNGRILISDHQKPDFRLKKWLISFFQNQTVSPAAASFR